MYLYCFSRLHLKMAVSTVEMLYKDTITLSYKALTLLAIYYYYYSPGRQPPTNQISINFTFLKYKFIELQLSVSFSSFRLR